MPLQWSEFLLTGVDEIDEQHRELFTVVNSFVQSIIDEKEKEEVQKLFKFLEDYTVLHFGTEEALLTKEGYPGLAVHKAQHAYFRRSFLALKAEYEMFGHSQELVQHTHRDVANWLLNHVGNADSQWARWLKQGKPPQL